ncbi:MAG: GTP-binding protein [Cellvibrionaceae bacterium]
MPQEKLSAIPTNIITGFLGAGKTSTILHLLKSKPENERWAVLVNEFGEIGVDGSLFQGQRSEEQAVYIREVPGGCMCCTAGLPMQVALNQLLSRAKPHRLLIEPTGLGHPIEILESLTAEHYSDVLSIQKTITLVDARKLDDTRYTEHETFNQQVSIADVVVGNKQDLYQEEHKALLKEYVRSQACIDVDVVFTEHGKLSADFLEGSTAVAIHSHHHRHAHDTVSGPDLNSQEIPECGYIKAVNQGEGFHSIGWRFDAEKTFNRQQLFVFLNGISVERMKAVFITDDGILGYNLTSDALTEMELGDCYESRIEIIAKELCEQWEEQLFACVAR